LPLILPYKVWKEHYAYTTDERILLTREEEEEVGEEVEAAPLGLPSVELVVFDLHGTLMCLHTKYADWLERLTDRYGPAEAREAFFLSNKRSLFMV
jgi:hypothetical protein